MTPELCGVCPNRLQCLIGWCCRQLIFIQSLLKSTSTATFGLVFDQIAGYANTNRVDRIERHKSGLWLFSWAFFVRCATLLKLRIFKKLPFWQFYICLVYLVQILGYPSHLRVLFKKLSCPYCFYVYGVLSVCMSAWCAQHSGVEGFLKRELETVVIYHVCWNRTSVLRKSSQCTWPRSSPCFVFFLSWISVAACT